MATSQPGDRALHHRVDTATPPHGNTVASPRGDTSQPEHVKLTFYLPPELADALEQCWQALRRQAPAAVRPRITRSLVAEHAMRRGLAGLADERGRAQLLQALGPPARAP